MSVRKVPSILFTILFVFWISETVFGFETKLLDINIDNSEGEDFTEVARHKKKKDKYLLPILLAGLMIKAIILPLAFKAMAAMTSVSVLLSMKSLIIASIMGFTKYAWSYTNPVKIFKVNDIWPKDDSINEDYSYYPDNVDYLPSFPPLGQIHHY